MTNNIWLKTKDEMLYALLADEAKNLAILLDQEQTLKQLINKSRFRLAIINQLKENK